MSASLARARWLLLLVPLAVPLLSTNSYYVHGVLCKVFVYAILVASLDLVVGYVGDVSIGHAGFFAIGAYTVAGLTALPALNEDSSLFFFAQWPFAVALVPAVLLTAGAGLVLGFPALRSSGPYLAVITIAYGLIISTVINESEPLTNGTRGISLKPLQVGSISLGNGNYLYLVYPALVVCLLVVGNLTHSYRGRALEALKYSAVAAECCGISRRQAKLEAFVLSAALAGFAGALFAQLDSYVGPTTFSYNFSVEMLIALIFGGVRSRLGNVLGALVVVLLPDLFSGFADYRLMVYGFLLLLVLFFLPGGLAGSLAAPFRRWAKRSVEVDRAALELASRALDPVQAPEASKEPALRLEAVTMMFGGLTAVNELSLELPAGRVLGLIGPNGSGKSTTVNLLTGVYVPTRGRVVSFGEDLTQQKSFQRARKGVARTFQNLQLFGPLSALDNVLVGLHPRFASPLWKVLVGLPSVAKEEQASRAQAFALLRFVGLEAAAFTPANALSYGQARHLEIARALALRPRLLLLDEPAAGLTTAEIGEINVLIGKVRARGISVLLIEHHMDMVMAISDEVVVLDFGKKIASGSPAEVQANPTVIEAYLGTHATALAPGAPALSREVSGE